MGRKAKNRDPKVKICPTALKYVTPSVTRETHKLGSGDVLTQIAVSHVRQDDHGTSVAVERHADHPEHVHVVEVFHQDRFTQEQLRHLGLFRLVCSQHTPHSADKMTDSGLRQAASWACPLSRPQPRSGILHIKFQKFLRSDTPPVSCGDPVGKNDPLRLRHPPDHTLAGGGG